MILPTKPFIDSTAQNIKGNTGAPTYPAPYQVQGPTCPPTSSNIKSASRTCPISAIPLVGPMPQLHRVLNALVQDDICHTYFPTAPITQTESICRSYQRPTIPQTNSIIESTVQDMKVNISAPTDPTAHLHQSPTVPPTSSNIRPARKICLYNTMPVIRPTPLLHDAPTVPPTFVNNKTIIPTCNNNQMSFIARDSCEYQIPPAAPTNSNSQLVIPAHLDNLVPSRAPTSCLHPDPSTLPTSSTSYSFATTCLNNLTPKFPPTRPEHKISSSQSPNYSNQPVILTYPNNSAPFTAPTGVQLQDKTVPTKPSCIPLTPTIPRNSVPSISHMINLYRSPTPFSDTFDNPPVSHHTLTAQYPLNIPSRDLHLAPNVPPIYPISQLFTPTNPNMPSPNVTLQCQQHLAPMVPPSDLNPRRNDITMTEKVISALSRKKPSTLPINIPSPSSNKKTNIPAITKLKASETEIQKFLIDKVNILTEEDWSLGSLQFINHFYGLSPCLKHLNPSKFLLQDILNKVLDKKLEQSLSSKSSRWKMETLTLPFSASLKDVNFDHILTTARRAIPPGLRERLTITIGLKSPIPLGLLLENSAFGKMSLEERLEDQSICHCHGHDEFKAMENCNHIITTDPRLIEKLFPKLFRLCKMGAKYRVQTKRITAANVYKAIDAFRKRMERKYGIQGNELLSYAQLMKALVTPLLNKIHTDDVVNIQPEIKRLHKMFAVTLVDKDSSGIAFVCKTIAHKLTKAFIYGPCHNVSGLYKLDPRPLDTVIATLEEYSMRRRSTSLTLSLPKFKIMMKMHKNSWSKAGRPISCELNSILARLSAVVTSALHALRPSFQHAFQRTLRRIRIYVDPGFSGPPVALDGNNGLPTRLRTINR